MVNRLYALLIALCVSCMPLVCSAQTSWDAASGFSLKKNSVGRTWTYGYRPTGGDTKLFTTPKDSMHCGVDGIACWAINNGMNPYPEIGISANAKGKRCKPVDFNQEGARVVLSCGMVLMRPGPNESAVLSFTAPKRGRYVINLTAQLIDNRTNGSTVAFSIGDRQKESKVFSGFLETVHFEADRRLQPGEKAEVVVSAALGQDYLVALVAVWMNVTLRE
jgi:hypothetical protein